MSINLNTKRIVFTQKDKAELLDFVCAEPQDTEVLVKIHYTAISSGTEKANLTGVSNIGIGISETAEAIFPRTVGYSGAGIVEAVGQKVTSVKPGDRVIVFWGVHTGLICIDEENIVKIEDDSLSLEEAAVLFISTFSAAAVRKCELAFGESAMVMGLGILGQYAVSICRLAGAYPVIAVDPVKERRDFALAGGADFAFDPFDENFVEDVKRVTGGGVNVCIEVTGLGKGLEQALDCMQRFGRVALLGCTRSSNFKIDYYSKVHGPGISLIGAHTQARPKKESHYGHYTHADEIRNQLKLASAGRIDYKRMICEIHSPAEAPEIYTRLINEKDFPIGVLFDWNQI